MTYRRINTTCPECKNNQIYYDSRHDETFCNKCGLILQDNTILLISTVITEEKQKEKTIRRLWYRKRLKLTDR